MAVVRPIRVASLALAILLGVPIGILIFRIEPLRGPVLGVLSVIYTIPSLSLLVLLIPLTGLSPLTAIIALVVYAQLVLVRNTLAGLMAVDPAIVEAARAAQPLLGDARELRPRRERCLLYTSPSPRDRTRSRMPSSA